MKNEKQYEALEDKGYVEGAGGEERRTLPMSKTAGGDHASSSRS